MRTDSPRTTSYESYDYLGDAKARAMPFDFPPEISRVESSRPVITPDQESHVQGLMDRYPVVSLHDHPTRRPTDPAQGLPFRNSGRDVTGYQGLAVSGLDAVFDNMMNVNTMIVSKGGWTWNDVVHDLGMRQCDFAHSDLVTVLHEVRDIFEAKRNGKVGVALTIESLTCIENELDRVEVLYGLGLRSAGLVYSASNQLGSGLAEPHDGGLTTFGRRVVERMNRVGMLIDVAHASDQTCLDAIEHSEKPIVISHRGARSVWPTARMSPDEVIKACAEQGGLIGVEAAPHTTLSLQHIQHTLESVMDHFEYCVDLVGIDHVTFGPDTNFGDHARWHIAFAESFLNDETGAPDYELVEFVDGIESPAEGFVNIVRWLVGHGYSDANIAKVIGGNVLRVLDEVWGGSTGG